MIISRENIKGLLEYSKTKMNSIEDIPKTTIVSAFITGVNKKKDMDISHYIEYGKKLLRLSIPKIIFVESSVYETHLTDEKYPLTDFVIISAKNDIYLYTYISNITDFNINSKNCFSLGILKILKVLIKLILV